MKIPAFTLPLAALVLILGYSYLANRPPQFEGVDAEMIDQDIALIAQEMAKAEPQGESHGTPATVTIGFGPEGERWLESVQPPPPETAKGQ